MVLRPGAVELGKGILGQIRRAVGGISMCDYEGKPPSRLSAANVDRAGSFCPGK